MTSRPSLEKMRSLDCRQDASRDFIGLNASMPLEKTISYNRNRQTHAEPSSSLDHVFHQQHR